LLASLGVAGIAVLFFGIDRWLAGGSIVRNIVQTCNIFSSGCVSAYQSFLGFAINPLRLLLVVISVMLVFAVIKTALMLIKAHNAAFKFDRSANEYPALASAMASLNVESSTVKVSEDSRMIAFTYGVNRPVICISSGAIELFEPDALTAILAHELSHVRKRDNFSIVIAMFVRDFLWFLPITHYLLSVFMREKEFAADDYAAELTGQPLAVADAIVSVAKALNASRNFSPAYAMFYTGDASVKTRINRLISDNSSFKPSFNGLFVSMVSSIVILATIGGIAYAQAKAFSSEDMGCAMGSACKQSDLNCCKEK
jgi:Zn-dependent protease with chaperone function